MDGKPRDTLQYKPDLECKKVLKKIDMARKSKNLSIHRLAEKAGIASSTLNEMLHGKQHRNCIRYIRYAMQWGFQ